MDDDDLFDTDDLFDLSTPTGLTFGIASGLLDDDIECSCTCGCTRVVAEEGDLCGACERGRHTDSPDRR